MPLVDAVAKEAEEQADYHLPVDGLPSSVYASASILHKLMLVIQSYDQSRVAAERSFLTLSQRVAAASAAGERRVMILDFIDSLAPHSPRRRSRRRVAAPYLDLDVAEELYRKQVLHGAMKQRIATAAIGRICQDMLRSLTSDSSFEAALLTQVVEALGIERFVIERVGASSRWQNKVAAFDALGRILRAIPGGHVFGLVDLGTSRLVARYALDPHEPCWIQISALRLLVDLSPDDALDAFRNRLADTAGPPDNLFVRKAIVEAVAERYRDARGHDILVQLAERVDPSEYVRMRLVQALTTFETEESRDLLRQFLQDPQFEARPQVRAQAVIGWAVISRNAYVSGDEEASLEAATMLAWAVANADEPNVQRIASEECVALCEFARQMKGSPVIDAVANVLLEALEETVAKPDVDLRLRRWAGSAWGSILTRRLPEWDECAPTLHARIEAVREGGSLRLARSEAPVDEAVLGRILAELSRHSLGLYASYRRSHVRIVRGDRMRLSLWRVLHEVRRLSPDKRQGFPHTIGRVFRGSIRAHSEILGEITRTKVPGERYHIEAEDTWRRYVPLVDDYLSLCLLGGVGNVACLYSSTGVTTVSGPARWFDRLATFVRLSWNYARVADLRNAGPRERGVGGVHEYLRVMREKYGMTTTFTPYTYDDGERVRQLHDPTIKEPMAEGSPVAKGQAQAHNMMGPDPTRA